MASGFSLLQLANFPGPFTQGKYRGVFKLRSISFGQMQGQMNGGSQPLSKDIVVTMPSDNFIQRLVVASVNGTNIKSAEIIFVTESDKKALVEYRRFAYTNVIVVNVDYSTASSLGDGSSMVKVSLYGQPGADR